MLLGTILGVKRRNRAWAYLVGFLRARFVSFSMVGGVCFLLLVSLTVQSIFLKGFSHYVQAVLPGGLAVAITVLPHFRFSRSWCFSSL